MVPDPKKMDMLFVVVSVHRNPLPSAFFIVLAFKHQQVKLLTATHQYEVVAR